MSDEDRVPLDGMGVSVNQTWDEERLSHHVDRWRGVAKDRLEENKQLKSRVAELEFELSDMTNKRDLLGSSERFFRDKVAGLEKALEEMTDLYREECDMAMDPSYEPKEDNNGN